MELGDDMAVFGSPKISGKVKTFRIAGSEKSMMVGRGFLDWGQALRAQNFVRFGAGAFGCSTSDARYSPMIRIA